MFFLRKRNKHGFEPNPVVNAIVLAIIVVILSIGSYNILGGFLSHQLSKSKALVGEFVDNIVLNAKSGEGIMTDDRNKRNIYVLQDGSNKIDVYAYKEIFEEVRENGAVRGVSTPVIKFDRFYELFLPMGATIKFAPDSQIAQDGQTEVGLQVDAPNGELTLFNMNSLFFKRFTERDKKMPNSEDRRGAISKTQLDGKTYVKEYWRGNVGADEQYGVIMGGCTPPSCLSYNKANIGVEYKGEIIGNIKIDKESNKIVFIPKGLESEKELRSEAANNAGAGNTGTTCENLYRGVCYPNNTYYEGKPESSMKQCTFYGGDCYKNGARMTLPNGDICTWQPGNCVVI